MFINVLIDDNTIKGKINRVESVKTIIEDIVNGAEEILKNVHRFVKEPLIDVLVN